MGALLACEEHLHITVDFSLKTDSELGLLCRFEQPTVIEAITAEGPCRHLLVKKYIKNTIGLEPTIAAFCKKYKKVWPASALTAELEQGVHLVCFSLFIY